MLSLARVTGGRTHRRCSAGGLIRGPPRADVQSPGKDQSLHPRQNYPEIFFFLLEHLNAEFCPRVSVVGYREQQSRRTDGPGPSQGCCRTSEPALLRSERLILRLGRARPVPTGLIRALDGGRGGGGGPAGPSVGL